MTRTKNRVDEFLHTLQAEPAPAAAPGEQAVPSRERMPLRNFHPVSQTNAHGKGAIFFGLVFAGMGSVPLLAALDVIHAPDSSFNVPRWAVAAMVSLFFVLPGILLVVHGIRGVLRNRRRRNLLYSHPDQPWRGDHRWNPDGETRTGWRAVRACVLQVIAFSLFLAPFHYLALREEGEWFFLIFIGLFDLVILGLAVYGGLLVARAVRYGRTRLVYEQFPVHPGQTLSLRFEMSRPRPFDRLLFRLVAVEEEYQQSDESTRIVPYRTLEMAREVPGSDAGPDGSGGVRIQFEIPADAPGTSLTDRPPHYWSLVVHGDTPGADYHEQFLVPIYERFAASEFDVGEAFA